MGGILESSYQTSSDPTETPVGRYHEGFYVGVCTDAAQNLEWASKRDIVVGSAVVKVEESMAGASVSYSSSSFTGPHVEGVSGDYDGTSGNSGSMDVMVAKPEIVTPVHKRNQRSQRWTTLEKMESSSGGANYVTISTPRLRASERMSRLSTKKIQGESTPSTLQHGIWRLRELLHVLRW